MTDAKPDTSEAAGTDWLATLQACVDGTNALTPTGERELLKLLRELLAERDAAKADVERLGRELNTSRYGPKHFGEDFHEKFGADLLAERNAAVIARDDAIRRLADAARDAGRWRGISEGNDIVIKHLRAERDALRAQLAEVLAENDAARFQLNNANAALREAGHE